MNRRAIRVATVIVAAIAGWHGPLRAQNRGDATVAGHEPHAKLPLAEARNLSGPWMQVSWYITLNMGPAAGLPPARQLRTATNKTPEEVLTPWAKEKSKGWTIYNDPL